tara:strand:- start:432 stop:2591 length:2160 start_codon:yes stop_codon:yes gene_type:complete
MPIPFALIGAAVGAGTNVLGNYLNKPKKSDYETQANTKGMDRYLAYLKGKSAGDEVTQLAMRPQLRAIGQQTARARRDIQGYMAGQGMEGSGAAAQARLGLQQQSAEQLTGALEKATALQIQERRQTGDKVAQVSSERAQAIEDARIRSEESYKLAQSQWKQQMKQSVIQGLGSVAAAGFSTLQTNQANMQAAHQAALASGAVDPTTTMDQFQASYKDSDFGTPQSYATSLGAQTTNQSILAQANEYLPPGKADELLAAGYTHQDLIKEIDYSRKMQQSYITAGVKSGTITSDNLGAYYDAMGGGSGMGTIDTTTNEVIEGGGISTPTTADETFDPTVDANEPMEPTFEEGGTGVNLPGLPTPGASTIPEDITGVIEPAPGSGMVSSVGQNMTPDRLANIAGGNLSDPFSIAGQSNVQLSVPGPGDLKANYEREVIAEKLREGGIASPIDINEQIALNQQLREGRAKSQEDIAGATLANQGVQPVSPEVEALAELEAIDNQKQYDLDRQEGLDYWEQRVDENAQISRQELENKLSEGVSELTGQTPEGLEQLKELELMTGDSEATDEEIDDLMKNLPPGEYESLQESIAGEGDLPKKRNIIQKWLDKRKYKKEKKKYDKGIQETKESAELMKSIRKGQRGRTPLGEGWEEGEIDIEEIPISELEKLTPAHLPTDPEWWEQFDENLKNLEEDLDNIPDEQIISHKKKIKLLKALKKRRKV